MILAIIQARMSSSRLPGKVLMPLAGAPMLARQVERVRRAGRIDALVLATSDQASDDPLIDLAGEIALPCYRGPLDDVLGRFTGALKAFGPANHVVRLTGDCPLADPAVIDAVIDLHLASGADYTNNTQELSFPKGQDVEIVRAQLLTHAAAETTDPYDREHVTPFFYRQPKRFKLANLKRDPPLGELRWTVDTREDYAFVSQVYDALYAANPAFTSEDVLALTRDWPSRGREG